MKRIIAMLLSIACIFWGVENVKADFNGTGGTGGGSVTSNSCGSKSSYCTWNNRYFTAVQLTLVYYSKSGGRRQIGHSVYIINTGRPDIISRLETRAGGSKYVIKDDRISTCGANGGAQKDGCYYGYEWLRKTYGNDESLNGPKQALNDLLNKMNVSPTSLTLPHNGKIDFNSEGYRILVEPIWNFIAPYQSGEYFMTVKELYRKGANAVDSTIPTMIMHSLLLNTQYNDIGIYAPNGTAPSGSTRAALADQIAREDWGWGYNIINPHKKNIKQCYKLSITGTNPVCTNTNKQNEGNYSESFVTANCEKEASNVVENATADGRLIKTVNNSCKIYCIESVNVKYPGNVLPAIQTGGYFVWPTFNSKIDKGHDLNITGTRTCKAVGTGCSGKVYAQDLYNNFNASIDVVFAQDNYNSTITLKKVNENETAKINNSDSINIYNGLKFYVTHNVNLKLPENTYRYVNKQTKIATSVISGWAKSMFTDIGFGNLPVSNGAKLGTNYYLKFQNVKLGANGRFNKLANEGANAPYTCTYQAKNTPSNCVCPSGTENAGQDLYCILAKDDTLNCPTAQEQYCNTKRNFEDDVCVSKYCPEPKQHISLDSCVAAGNTYSSCVDRVCNGNPDNPDNPDGGDPDPDNPPGGRKYQCPKNTPNEFMDISPCVESQISKGKTEEEAIEYCKDVVCPMKGIPIIYRTISLKNPFPSKSLNGNVSGFNADTNNGRYPGANWNSKTLVDKQIRNNRGVKDSAVYDKEPLYTFVIDGSNIRAIRNYNKTQAAGAGYSDFTLECKGKTTNAAGTTIEDGSKCYSKVFLRNEKISGLVGGVCANTNAADFDKCAES